MNINNNQMYQQDQKPANILFINGYVKEGFDELDSRYSTYNYYNNTKNKLSNDQPISLLSKESKFDIYKYIPQQFTITTNNSSGKFNKLIFENTSSIILEFSKENPNQMEYHLDISDTDNTILKFEQLYKGQKVTFEEDELLFTRKFTEKLNLINFPNFIKPKSLKSNPDTSVLIKRMYPSFFHNRQVDYSDLSVKISKLSFQNYIKNESNCTFKIQTRKYEYKCSIFGVLSSTLIRDLLAKDPSIDHYFYDYEDDENEFQIICDIFNFNKIKLTRDNAEIIKEICEDLSIECISMITEKFIVDSEKVSKTIDDQQNIIDTIDELFELLYNIKDKSIIEVARIILESKWSSTEEKVNELSAFILQVISNSVQLHPYLVDLLQKLDENSNDRIELKKLLPFIVKRLLENITDDFLDINNQNFFIYPFVFRLYKKNIISEDQLMAKLKNPKNRSGYQLSWFFPEIMKSNLIYSKYALIEQNGIIYVDLGFKGVKYQLFYPCNPNKLEEYKRMRDKCEYDDEIANALRVDDVDTFQSIVTKSGDNFLCKTIRKNLFEPFFKNDTRFLNYAAAYGSIKCFKYLLLNDENIDESTFSYAIYGGNNELIRIVDNEKKKGNVNSTGKQNPPKFSFGKINKMNKNDDDALIQSIKIHRNDLFDWILEQNPERINQKNNYLYDLMMCSIKNGNAHSIVQLIDNGFKFQNYRQNYSNFLELSSRKGFYLLTNLLMNIFNKDLNQSISINPSKTVYFGNVLIFQLFEKTMNQANLQEAIIYAIKYNSISIIKYFFEKLINQTFKLNEENSEQILKNSIMNNSDEVLNYITEKINGSCPLNSFKISSLYDLLKTAISQHKIQISKKIIDLIYENNSSANFTEVLYEAVLSNMKEIIEYLNDKKCILYYEDIVNQIIDVGSIDVEIFSLIMNNVDYEMKQIMTKSINDAIRQKNKPLIDYLLKQDALLPSSLIEAVQTNDIEIVDMILKKNSSQSFINQNLKNGTALFISVKNNNIPILKRLISIPGIDPSIYYKDMKTPLILSASELNYEIFCLIIEFYGEKIKTSEKWQIEKSIEFIEKIGKEGPKGYYGFQKISNNNNNENSKINQEKKIKILNKIAQIQCIDPNYCFNDNTFFTYACKINAIEVVESFLQYENIDVNVYSPEKGDTPLITAIRNKNEEISKLLIEYHGTDINQGNYEEKTPLYYAVLTDQEKIVELLFKNEKFDPNKSNINFAFLLCNVSICKIFLSFKDFDVNCISFIDKDSPFLKDFIFANQNNMMRNDISINKRNKSFFESRLMIAVKKNEKEIIENIINHPLFDKSRSQYFNAIEIALFDNKIELLKSSFNLDINFHTNNDNNSMIKFDVCKIDTNENIISYCLKYPSMNRIEIETNQKGKMKKKNIFSTDQLYDSLSNFMFSNGIDPNEPLENGLYPFEEVIQNDLVDAFLFLVQSGLIDFTKLIPDKDQPSQMTSYFHLAARLGKMDILQALIENQNTEVFSNITNSVGDNIFIEAVRYSQKDAVELLCNFDVIDFKHRNDDGENALEILFKMHNKKIEWSQDDINNMDRGNYLSLLYDEMHDNYHRIDNF